MKRIRYSLIALALLTAVLAACSTPTATTPTEPAPAAPATTNEVQGVVWQWQTLNDTAAGTSMRVDNPGLYSIVFNVDGTTEGQADCNTFSGTYSQEGGFFITVRPDVMAACDIGSLDQQFLTLLGDVVAGGPDGGGGLTLQTAGGAQSMLFSYGGTMPIME
jgi:heat shock protein HslJ